MKTFFFTCLCVTSIRVLALWSRIKTIPKSEIGVWEGKVDLEPVEMWEDLMKDCQ